MCHLSVDSCLYVTIEADILVCDKRGIILMHAYLVALV